MSHLPRMLPDGSSTARLVGCTALFASVSTCAIGAVPWWMMLPLWIAACEFIALLFDHRVFGLGRVVKRPSPPEMFQNPDKNFTWQEVAEHNSEESAWIAIDGKVYDITAFVDRHPGGKELLLLAVGRDATDLFNSYHPFTDTPRTVLKKYCIGSLSTYEHPVYKPDSGFYRECAESLKSFFAEHKLDSKNPWTGLARMTPVYIAFAIAFYYGFLARDVPTAVRFALAAFLGACQGMPLTGWMHDASHASIGHTERWWWNVGRFSLDYFSGSSMLSWRNQHVIGHHVYTNVMGADPDLPVLINGDPRRLVPEQVWHAVYKFQHIYLPPLYGVLALKSRLGDMFDIFPMRRNGPIRVNPISVQDYLRMATSKGVWFFYRVVLPLVFFEDVMSPRLFAMLFFTVEFGTGYWLGFNFQVSHVSTECDFLYSDPSKRASEKCPAVFKEEWAISQVETTVDYAHGDPVAAYLSGALNYQSVHHLFPTVSQYHYPKVAPVVMEIAKKHGLRFNHLPNFMCAFAAHVKHLKELGSQGIPGELKLE